MYDRYDGHTRANYLVVPLGLYNPRIRALNETTGYTRKVVAQLHGGSAMPSTMQREQHDMTLRISTTPGSRTSTMATRTTTIRTTTTMFGRFADHYDVDLTVDELLCAYYDCRRHKRNTLNAIGFETNLERNIMSLYRDLMDGSYQPGNSICFVVTKPKPREVWAADFRDRIVHHLLYNRVSDRFYRSFIVDSCACIPGRGTLYAAERLEHKIRGITRNWSTPAFYLKLDLANFFVSINKNILRDQLARKIHEPWLMRLAETVLYHDPRCQVIIKSSDTLMALVPPYKSLFNQPPHLGLPIGNLSSQFFANVYMNDIDQFIKHSIKAKHYIRYVDDMLLLHESPEWLIAARKRIEEFAFDKLGLKFNPRKTIQQPLSRGVDFVGQIIKPWRRTLRRQTYKNATHAIVTKKGEDLFKSINSYFGLFRQTTHSHIARSRIARIVLNRGFCVDYKFTKSYRKQPGGI